MFVETKIQFVNIRNKDMKNILTKATLAACLAAVMTIGASAAQADDTVVLRVGYANNPGEPFDLGCQKWKEIIEEEEATEREELGDDYEEDDNKYDGPDFWMLYVTGINEKEIEGHLISIDQWNTWYRPYPKTYSHKSLDRAIAIPKDAFEEAKNIIKTTVFTLLAEMKQKVNTIEIK